MYNLELSSDWRDDVQNRFLQPGENPISRPHLGLYKQVGTPVGRLVDWLAHPDDFSERVFQYHGLTDNNVSTPTHSKPFLSDEIVIVPIRELSYDDAKKEISEYIKRAGYRKVYISELAEELLIDFELIEEIIEELEMRKGNRFLNEQL